MKVPPVIYHLSLWLIAISVTASCGAQLAATYWDAPGAEGRENDRVTLLAQASSPKERNAEAKPAAVESSEGAIDEAPLLEFVERHQPSLQKLLRYMKQKQPKQYENALKSCHALSSV